MCKGNCGECICGKKPQEQALEITEQPSHWITGLDDEGVATIAISEAMAEAIGMKGDKNIIPITVKVQTLDGKLTPIQEIESPTFIMSPYMNPAAMGFGVHEVNMMYPDTSTVEAFEAVHGEIDNIGRGILNPIFIGDHNIDEHLSQDMLEEIHNGNLTLASVGGDVSLTADSVEVQFTYNESVSIIEEKTPFQQARELMGREIFEDQDLLIGYQSNVAMHLHDHYGITDYETRNKAALEILEIIFK